MSIPMTANQPVIAIREYVSFETDVLAVLKADQAIGVCVSKEEARYRDIDVARIMAELRAVGSLLDVAYAGSKGFNCNSIVVSLLSDYQALSKETQIACNKFLAACMQALEDHRLIIQLVYKKPTVALKRIGGISTIASEMSKVAGNLVDCADNMRELAKQALVEASKDNAMSKSERQHIEQQLAELEAQKAKHETTQKELASSISAALENEAKAVEQVDGARREAFFLALAGLIVDPIAKFSTRGFVAQTVVATAAVASERLAQGSAPSFALDANVAADVGAQIAEKKGLLAKSEALLASETDDMVVADLKVEVAKIRAEVQSLEETRELLAAASARAVLQNMKQDEANSVAEREAQIRAERIKLQEQDRQVKAELAESLAKLKSTQEEASQLSTALRSLDLAIKALGKIKTVFENTRVYWVTVGEHCSKLANKGTAMMDLTDEDFKDVFAEAVTNSWYSWLALAKTNYHAAAAIKHVVRDVDRVMGDLPTAEEANDRLSSAIAALKLDLEPVHGVVTPP